MEKLLTAFVQYLRKNEIDIPTSSLEESLCLLPYMNVKNREDFQISLSQIFVKQVEKKERFDLCFQEFFFEQIQDIIFDIEKKQAKEELEDLSSDFSSRLQEKQEKRKQKKEKQEEKSKNANQQKEKWKQFLEEVSSSEMENELHEIAKQIENKNDSGMNEKDIEKLKETKPKNIQQYIEELIWKGIETEQPSYIFDSIHQLQKEMNLVRNDVFKFKQREETLLNLVEKKQHSGMRKMIVTSIDVLKNRPINRLPQKELEELREYIRQHTKGLMTRFSNLLKQTHLEKEMDMQKIIQHSTKTYGVPMELFYMNHKKNKTNIDVILDVSGSVIKSAELLLMFIYLLYQHFPNQIRVFTFVGELTEVTSYMKEEDWEEMLDFCLKQAPIDYRGYSDYDRAFGIYEKEYMERVTKDSLIFIVGDARNNKNDARIKTFQTLQEKAKSVYWFNPENKKEWNTGDSVIGKYQSYANCIFETTTTKKLLQSLEHISKTFLYK